MCCVLVWMDISESGGGQAGRATSTNQGDRIDTRHHHPHATHPCPEEGLGLGHLPGEHLGEAEVDDLHLGRVAPAVRQEEVLCVVTGVEKKAVDLNGWSGWVMKSTPRIPPPTQTLHQTTNTHAHCLFTHRA